MTKFSGKRAHNVLKRIAFERVGASAGERQASRILCQFLREGGLKPREETFTVWTFSDASASLEVFHPYRKTIPAAPLGLSGNTPPGGVEGELFFAETGGGRFIDPASGKIPLIYRGFTFQNYGRLAAMKVPAIIRIDDPARELMHVKLGRAFFEKHGKIPQVYIRFEDGLELIRRKAKRVRVRVTQKESRRKSRNIVAEVRGTHSPEEILLVGGHFDSVPLTEGAHDNAGGAAAVVELARIFASCPPRRTLRFVLFGSEEMGLLGSWDYATRHKRDLKKIKLMVNLDVGGGLIGINEAFVTASQNHEAYVRSLGMEEGIDLHCRLSIYSSDSIPFSYNGVPAVNITRGGGAVMFGHTCGDQAIFTDPGALEITGAFSLSLLQRLANAVEFPLEKKIDNSIKKDILEYLRKRGEEDRKGRG